MAELPTQNSYTGVIPERKTILAGTGSTLRIEEGALCRIFGEITVSSEGLTTFPNNLWLILTCILTR